MSEGQKLYPDLIPPSLSNLKQFIRGNIVKNNPVMVENVQLAKDAFAKYIATLKGKSTRPHLPVVTREGVIDLPPELQVNEVELAIDVLLINNQAFLHARGRTIKFKDLVQLDTVGKNKSYCAMDLFKGLDQVLLHYNKGGIMITTVHSDNVFKLILTGVIDR